MRTYKLSQFIENPDNPSSATDEAFARVRRIVEKNPKGLRADRIAFVTDHPSGKFVVISGCKRLRALKELHGEDFEAPAEWFADVTRMTEAERNEFIVDANVNDGKFDREKMRELYSAEELAEWVGDEKLGQLIAIAEDAATPAPAPSGDTPKLVELKFLLPSKSYQVAIEHLRKRNDDLAIAFMEVINGRA